MTLARLSEGYEPRFDIDYEFGRQGELLIGSVIEALKTESAEVKTDAQSLRTGNLYVEFECLRRDGWHRSGLATTEAEVWCFVLGTTGLALVVQTEALKEICRPLRRAGKVAEERDGSHPTRGVLLPIAHLVTETRKRGMS